MNGTEQLDNPKTKPPDSEEGDSKVKTEIERAWAESKPLTTEEAIQRSRAAMNRIFKESLRERMDSLGF